MHVVREWNGLTIEIGNFFLCLDIMVKENFKVYCPLGNVLQ